MIHQYRNYIFLFSFLLLTFCFHAQPSTGKTDLALALQYFDQREFEKANSYFENLYDKNPLAVYPHYYKSLMEVKDYNKAEKITKRQIRNNPASVYLFVNLGRVYKEQGDLKKERESYEKAIKELPDFANYVIELATVFVENGLYDYALQTYDKAASKDYPYFYEKAEVYKQKGDLKAMVNVYLDAIEFRESELVMVQNHLQNSLGYDDEEGGMKNPILKQELLRRLQKNPEKIIFSELLVFIQKQQKDFEGAFIQAKALDKRLHEEGSRVYDLSRICSANEDWLVAKKCLDYILEKGPANLYYDGASVDLLNVEYQALTRQPQPKKEELIALEEKLKVARQKYAGTHLNAYITKTLASLQAFYLDQSSTAIVVLSDLIKEPGLDAQTKAEYKMLQADIYVIAGQIWEASLLYSQVEKDFKYEAIGQEAKFHNAKLSYYTGDFAWAKAQCDVLKGATSKLIANDALDLSLIISDATGIDTNSKPLQIFATAELMLVQHKYKEALAALDSINKSFSAHSLGDDVAYKKAEIFKKLGKFPDAETMYKNILDYYATELYGDDAQFKLAELYQYSLKDKAKAEQAYQDVLTKYPGSIYVVEARKRYRELRGDKINN